MSKAGSSYGCAARSAATTASCASSGNTVSSRYSSTRCSTPGLADRGIRPLAAEEGAGAVRVPGAALVVADPPGAGGEHRLAHVVQRVTGHEDDELPVHALSIWARCSLPE